MRFPAEYLWLAVLPVGTEAASKLLPNPPEWMGIPVPDWQLFLLGMLFGGLGGMAQIFLKMLGQQWPAPHDIGYVGLGLVAAAVIAGVLIGTSYRESPVTIFAACLVAGVFAQPILETANPLSRRITRKLAKDRFGVEEDDPKDEEKT